MFIQFIHYHLNLVFNVSEKQLAFARSIDESKDHYGTIFFSRMPTEPDIVNC